MKTAGNTVSETVPLTKASLAGCTPCH